MGRYNNSELIRAFANNFNGDPVSRGNRRETLRTEVLDNGDLALIGYGWQTLAVNDGDDITLYEGWEDWAWEQYDQPGKPTTARHIDQIREVADPDRTSNIQRRAGAAPDSVRQIGRIGMLD